MKLMIEAPKNKPMIPPTNATKEMKQALLVFRIKFHMEFIFFSYRKNRPKSCKLFAYMRHK